MWTKRLTLWRLTLCVLVSLSALAALSQADGEIPSESQCRPYIEKALKELESGDSEKDSTEKNDSSELSINDDTNEISSSENDGETLEAGESNEDDTPSVEIADEPYVSQLSVEDLDDKPDESSEDVASGPQDEGSVEQSENNEQTEDGDSKEDGEASAEETAEQDSGDEKESEDGDETEDSREDSKETTANDENDDSSKEDGENDQSDDINESADEESSVEAKDDKSSEDDDGSHEKADDENKEDQGESLEEREDGADEQSDEKDDHSEDGNGETNDSEEAQDDGSEDKKSAENETSGEDKDESIEEKVEAENKSDEEDKEDVSKENDEKQEQDSKEDNIDEGKSEEAKSDSDDDEKDEKTSDEEEGAPEEDLLLTGEIPENLRSREHINQILRLDEEASEAEITVERSADIVLRDLKRLYENSIKPLEGLYKYRDLSNRHFGDPEIFSKPLVLFMGPWSGGKSSIVNYLTGLEFTEWSLRTGAEPSPAYFNILMHGKDPQVLDGTQLAADWTFSGLQKFGQGLEERLRGLKHPSKILEKVNIVEIPGILEVRKQVSRVFPFNDACQWFIDRADIIFLVYDPSKLDVGPETEAILDQLKGRESQTRIVLNKADSVKPEELMRVQSALIWNISPLMSSPQPPVMYTVSLWSMPYEGGAPVRLLQAQERELLRDLRHAIDKRIENKIASARRFAVRVRNHAKMVDCYLTTYYNHKTIFGNKKLIADAITENPQNYHIYEGLSTLTNISRYDLPDPETYRDFFRLNPLYEFQQLSATCTYFRGCPITRLDVAIAYDLPELVGKYKKMVESATPQGMPKS
ncbi:sarcalumenin isoform X1 [Bombyx mandarina]|uniref:Sarcalumenin isoform X1 n=1 Tax=Bombyx mandarina TaxID=7092 RepID=A0A6J2JP26_BOMMA|nr:sarcalumenin isoform X1 [Bombyx mandarina]XP_028031032.1 sarcalumenin isoform X1 [Bombyx mandarina]XP_028031033.1 sarcalumenin isoform X1 [Bombyx mandarina]